MSIPWILVVVGSLQMTLSQQPPNLSAPTSSFGLPKLMHAQSLRDNNAEEYKVPCMLGHVTHHQPVSKPASAT